MTDLPERRPAAATRLLRRLGGLAGQTKVLLVVGVVALVLAGVLGFLTIQDLVGDDSEKPVAAPAVETERVVSRRGGFAVAAPTDMKVTRRGRVVQLTGPGGDLVVSVGPGSGGPLRSAHVAFIGTVERDYRRTRLLVTERSQVAGRPALVTSGTALNDDDVALRFVVMTVAANPRNYTLVAFAGRASDPASVLPRVNAVANGFEVLRRGRQ